MKSLPRLKLPETPDRLRGVYWRASTAFVDELGAWLQGKRVLEIFAGNGYLAALLQAKGIAVRPTTRLSSHDAHEYGFYAEVEELEASDAVDKYGSNSDVLLVTWPTATEATLRAAELWGADRDIVFIGQMTDYSKGHLGGCASDSFFERFDVQHRFTQYRTGDWMEHAVVGKFSPSENFTNSLQQ